MGLRSLLIGLISLSFFISCQKENSFEVGQLAKGSLQSAAGDCLPKTVYGTYKPGVALNDTNALEVSVNVGTTGAYTITTDTVNGYSFKANGNFTATGGAIVKLKAYGTPTVAGTDNFTVRFDTTICVVQVTVAASGGGGGGGTGNTDYFPLTSASWWSYDTSSTTNNSDTLKTVVNGSATYGGNVYQRLITSENGVNYDSSYYRKDATTGFYYNYVPTAPLVASGFPITFSQPGLDILFLKNTLATNETWNSDFNGTASGGIPVVLRFKYTCINNNQTITVNGKSFSNVYQVKMQVQIGSFGVFNDAGAPTTFYYAKGIGSIQTTDGSFNQPIRWWVVN
jgi:hypothetical protein